MIMDGVSEIVLQDACASVSTRAAGMKLKVAFKKENAGHFCVPQPCKTEKEI